MSDLKLLGVCGLYCGACNHYRASFPDGKHLLKEAEGFTCQGCRSGKLYINSGCAECKLRSCAEDKGIIHCGLCSEFPCGQLKEFQTDGRLHHLDVLDNLKELKTKGHEQWLLEQEKRWKCKCGVNFSWYEKLCHNCGLSLDSYGTAPK